MEYEKVTETIIGCAYRVYNKMGFGFLESVYEKCLLIELRKEGLNAETQKPITVYYEGEVVGEFVADIMVNDAVIIEVKSVRRIIKAHACPVKFVSMTAKRISLGKSNWLITLLLQGNLWA